MRKKRDIINRRNFISVSTKAFTGITLLPCHVIQGLGHKLPSDKLNIAGIGVGGRGFANLKCLESENIIALCDVDWKYSKPVFDYFPKAKRYKDWRAMYDELGKSIDGIVVATSDHTHAIIAAHAITMGKHVYLQKPLTHKGWPEGKEMNNGGGGVIFHGSKDTLICGSKGREPFLISGRLPVVREFRRRIKETHEMDWVRACKENPGNRIPTASDFSEAGPFNEMVLMGVLAVRLQSLNKELEWDGQKMEFTNIGNSETIKTVIKDGFEIKEGHPTFNNEWTDPVNAREFTYELIKHTYRDPWTLPEMPI